jgi:hypothetical protein
MGIAEKVVPQIINIYYIKPRILSNPHHLLLLLYMRSRLATSNLESDTKVLKIEEMSCICTYTEIDISITGSLKSCHCNLIKLN